MYQLRVTRLGWSEIRGVRAVTARLESVPLRATCKATTTPGQTQTRRRLFHATSIHGKGTGIQLSARFCRHLFSCSASSGVMASPKSAASKTGRISISPGSGIGLGQRLTHSMASSIPCTFQIQKPATSSFVAGRGRP